MTDEDPAVLERVDAPVLALDEDWRFTYVNGAAESLLDAPEGTLKGRVIWDVLSGLMETSVPGALHRARSTGESTETVASAGDKEVRFEAHPGEDGMTVLLSDVTDRRGRERQLRQYERAFTAAEDPIYVLDTDGTFREVNDAMVELTGYDREALIGQPFAMLIDEDERERAERRIRDALFEDEESVGRIEATLQAADGTVRHCEVNVALLRSDEGMEGTVGVIRDVTGQRQREQRLAVLDRVLRHNIRNEMNVVLGRAEAIERVTDDEDIAEHVRRIGQKAKDLVGMSEDIRRFSDALAPSVGTARPRETFEVVVDVVEEFRKMYPDAEVRIRVKATPWMYVHESVLAAVEEVVHNAIVHNDRPEPTVEVTIDAHGDAETGEVTIAVADDGPGLPEDERAVLTGDGETPLNHASGIGLWLVNWAVRKSGGHLSFAENDPRGSVVRIHLQQARPPDEASDPEAGADRVETDATTDPVGSAESGDDSNGPAEPGDDPTGSPGTDPGHDATGSPGTDESDNSVVAVGPGDDDESTSEGDGDDPTGDS